MPFFFPFRQRKQSISSHPSLEVGPGIDPQNAIPMATSVSPCSYCSGKRFALAAVAFSGIAGAVVVVASGSSSLRVTTRSSGAKFDPETYAARGLSYEERMSEKSGGRATLRESAEGYRKLQLSGFGEAAEGGESPGDERSVIGSITNYDTSTSVALPSFYDNFEDIWQNVVVQDQPLLWYVPKAGGNTLNKIFAHCLNMVMCSSVASTVTGALDGTTLVKNTFADGTQYINADPSTTDGLQKLADGGIVTAGATADSGADVIITQRLEASKMLFSSAGKGRLFVMLRNPIKRVVDQFYYRQRATWEAGYDSTLAIMSLEEFAASDRLVENFVVRSLVHKLTTDVTAADVELAKNILRQKFVVGIFEWFDLSVVRFEKYFGWWDEHSVLTDTAVNHCHYDRISTGGHVGTHPKAENGSEAYKKIAVRNWADLELYFYAKNLFYQQAALI